MEVPLIELSSPALDRRLDHMEVLIRNTVGMVDLAIGGWMMLYSASENGLRLLEIPSCRSLDIAMAPTMPSVILGILTPGQRGTIALILRRRRVSVSRLRTMGQLSALELSRAIPSPLGRNPGTDNHKYPFSLGTANPLLHLTILMPDINPNLLAWGPRLL